MILALLQARMSSRRLPGKVLAPVLDEPMIVHQIRRIRRATKIDRLVVATSDQPSDDHLAQVCEQSRAMLFRGSLDDVLDRCYQAALPHRPDHIVRLTADCPLIDPAIIDEVCACHLAGGYDYTSNVQQRSFPDGLDVEICRFGALEQAWRQARTPPEREHVTLYLRSGDFRIGHLVGQPNLSHHRWTVDYDDDLDLVRRIYGALYPRNPNFTMSDVLRFLNDHPYLGVHGPRHESTSAAPSDDVGAK